MNMIAQKKGFINQQININIIKPEFSSVLEREYIEDSSGISSSSSSSSMT